MKVRSDFLENALSFLPHSNRWILVLALCLISFSIFDLVYKKFIKNKIFHALIVLVGVMIIGQIIVMEAILLGRSPGYEPDQPILFSHRQHAGENKINCVYCHTGVTDSRYAGIPPVSLCLNCHNVIKKGPNTGTAEIAKIYQAVDSGVPVQWVKVHQLPDFVFFSHAQHVNVGKIQCIQCHGDVEQMGRIQQVSDLSMGWCINCHRQTEVNFSNPYYASYRQQNDLKSGKISRVTVDDVGGNNCSKCHY